MLSVAQLGDGSCRDVSPPSTTLLTSARPCLYHLSSLLFGADLGFHEEWLRDEPFDATTTGSGSSISVDRCQLSPWYRGNMRFGVRRYFLHLVPLFLIPGKEDFVF
jgi:hypothetical protein